MMSDAHHPDEPGYGPLSAKSADGVLAEWLHWDRHIRNATSWGAAVGAAMSFRKAAASELRRRGIEVPT